VLALFFCKDTYFATLAIEITVEWPECQVIVRISDSIQILSSIVEINLWRMVSLEST